MRILFTGASSFTGYWFANELVRAGHDVVAIFQRASDAYDGIRAERVAAVAPLCRPTFTCSFGDRRFLDVIDGEKRWDALCHHAADAADYKSPDFDVGRALENNTRNLGQVLMALRARACRKLVLTGSAFENDEGAGSEDLPAFSPYGLSKGLTAQVFRYYAATSGMRLGKFVIPNPFGPFEDPRFTAYLIRTWQRGEVAVVQTPAYVRDNIHVSLLAKVYRRFVEGLSDEPGFERINPSGYVESQGRFAERLAQEMRGRLNLPCLLELKEQNEFREPRVRHNTDIPDAASLDWRESDAWDEIAAYYAGNREPARRPSRSAPEGHGVRA